jgi:hypothetical protein
MILGKSKIDCPLPMWPIRRTICPVEEKAVKRYKL